jgi:hypothetical protein
MRLVLLSLLVCSPLFLVSSAQAQQKSVSALEDEVTSAVKAKTAPVDDKSMHDLSALKVDLIDALKAEIATLSKDTNDKSISDVGRSVIQSAITDDQTKLDSLIDSLGKWTTGFEPAAVAGKTQQPKPAPPPKTAVVPCTVTTTTTTSSVPAMKTTTTAPCTNTTTVTTAPVTTKPASPAAAKGAPASTNKPAADQGTTAAPTPGGAAGTAGSPAPSTKAATSPQSTTTKTEVTANGATATTTTTTTPPATPAPASQDSGGNTLFTRSTVGVTVAAANGAPPTARFFADFDLTAPLFGTREPLVYLSRDCRSGSPATSTKECTDEQNAINCQQHRYTVSNDKQDCKRLAELLRRNKEFIDPLSTRLWGFWNPRITSVSQSNVAIGSVASGTTSIFQNAATTDLTKLVQTFEMEQGLELRLATGGWMPDQFTVPDASGKNGGTRVGIYGFASYGTGVPVTGYQNVTTVYLGNPTLDALYGAPAGTQFIAVEERSKDRFYRDFYVGLRLKTFSYSFRKCPKLIPETTSNQTPTDDANSTETNDSSPTCAVVKNQFPGTYEVSWGQDDAINGQTLTGGVVRVRGFYPLPFANYVHLFGGVDLSLKHKTFVNGADFVTAPGNITATSPGVFQAAVNPPARDQYQFGIGVDLIKIITQAKAKQTSQQQTAGKPSTDTAAAPSGATTTQ